MFNTYLDSVSSILSSSAINVKNDPIRLFNSIHTNMHFILTQKQILKSDTIERIYYCYAKIITQLQEVKAADSLIVMEDISALLFKRASKNGFPWKTLSDECLLSIITTIRLMSSCWPESVWVDIYESRNWPLVGHMVSFLLEVGEWSHYRSLQVEALTALRCMTIPIRVLDSGNNLPESLVPVVRCTAYLLPGICQTMHRIVTSDMKVGSLVKEAALDTWRAIFLSLFSKVWTPADALDSQFPDGQQNPAIFSPAWYSTTLANITRLTARTIDHLLYTELDVCLSSNYRLSSASLRWLEQLLLNSYPPILTSKDGEKLRDVLVAGIIALTTESTLSPGSLSTGRNDASATDESVPRQARLTLQKYTGMDRAGPTQNYHIPSACSLPVALTNELLIRRISMETLMEMITALLPHSLRVLDEAQLQKRLRSMLSYIELLGSEGLSVLSSSRDSMHRLCAGLAELLTLDTKNVQITDVVEPSTYAKQMSSAPTPANLFPKSFDWFRDPKTFTLIQSVAGQIARSASTFDVFVDTCRDLMLQSGYLQRNPCFLLLSAALAGYLGDDSIDWSERNDAVLRLLTEYFDEQSLINWIGVSSYQRRGCPTPAERPLSLPDGQQSYKLWPVEQGQREEVTAVTLTEPDSPAEFTDTPLTICVLLELVATAAQVYARATEIEDARLATEEFIRTIIRPCLGLASHPALVGRTATACLRQVAQLCGYSSLTELVDEQAGHLVASLTLDLHRVYLLSSSSTSSCLVQSGEQIGRGHPLAGSLEAQLAAACRALTTLFEYSSVAVLPALRPIIRQVLSCLDLTYEHHASLFLTPLHRLIVTCRRWDRSQRTQGAGEDRDSGQTVALVGDNCLEPFPTVPETMAFQQYCALTLDRIRDQVEETRRVHSCCWQSQGAPQQSLTAEDKADETNGVAGCEDTARIVEEVLLRCIHLMADRHPRHRMLSMDIVMEGCVALEHNKDLLLPIVHKSWSALMTRFRDQKAIVVEKAFHLLTVLTTVAGDFLRSRAASDVFPPILEFLRRGAQVSAAASSSYRHLTTYRVQRRVLSQLGLLATQSCLPTESLRPVVSLLTCYLANDQPEGLRRAAVRSLQQLWRQDPGVVWVGLLAWSVGEQTELFSSSRLKFPAALPAVLPPVQVRPCAEAVGRSKSAGISTSYLSEMLLETLPWQAFQADRTG